MAVEVKPIVHHVYWRRNPSQVTIIAVLRLSELAFRAAGRVTWAFSGLIFRVAQWLNRRAHYLDDAKWRAVGRCSTEITK
jgi:hypothetical protein